MQDNDLTVSHGTEPSHQRAERSEKGRPADDQPAKEGGSVDSDELASNRDERSLDAAQSRQFGLASPEGVPHARWLAEQLEGYTHWYSKSGFRFELSSRIALITATSTGLAATILAAAPTDWQSQLIPDFQLHWAVAILAAITTVINGLLPALSRLARDREEGRIQMTRLRQELDILKGNPTLDTFLGAQAVIQRIAAIERSCGGGGKE